MPTKSELRGLIPLHNSVEGAASLFGEALSQQVEQISLVRGAALAQRDYRSICRFVAVKSFSCGDAELATANVVFLQPRRQRTSVLVAMQKDIIRRG